MHDRHSWSDWLDAHGNKGVLGYSETSTTESGETEGTTGGMDDYFFQNHVRACKNVAEATSYLEIFNYSVRCRPLLGGHPLAQLRLGGGGVFGLVDWLIG